MLCYRDQFFFQADGFGTIQVQNMCECCLHGMTFLIMSKRNPLWTPLDVTVKLYFLTPPQYICNGLIGCKTQNYYLSPPIKTNTCHIFHSAPSSSSTAGSCLLSVVVNCVCVYVLKIIPQDTILCSINAFIIDREERQGGLPSSRSQPLSWRRLWQQPQPRQQPTRPPQPVPPP